MTIIDIRKIIELGESEKIEFKLSTGQRSRAAQTICAMLNGQGGFVFFGIKDNGEICGQDVSTKTMEDIGVELRKIEPMAHPDIEIIKLDNRRSIIAIRVSGNTGLYVYDGRPYIRIGPTTSVMPKEEYDKRVIQQLHSNQRWESEPVPSGVTVGDLDEDEIQLLVDEAIRLGRINPGISRDIKSVLLGLDLIKNGSLLNAAVALFGKGDHLKILYPQFSIRL